MRPKTRRSISVSGLTYARVKSHCTRSGLSVSGLLERLIAAEMDRVGEPVATELAPMRQRDPEAEAAFAGSIFTW